MDISDPTQIPTPSEIKIESRSTKQKINGYLKIAKNTKIYADNPGKMPTASPHHISASLSPDDFQESFQTNRQGTKLPTSD